VSDGFSAVPSVLWHCWLGVRKSIRPVKLSDEVLVWLSVWSEVQIVCIWSSWCHCHPKTPSSSRPVLPFWYRLTEVVLEKRPLNGCSNSSSGSSKHAMSNITSNISRQTDCKISKNFYFFCLCRPFPRDQQRDINHDSADIYVKYICCNLPVP